MGFEWSKDQRKKTDTQIARIKLAVRSLMAEFLDSLQISIYTYTIWFYWTKRGISKWCWTFLMNPMESKYGRETVGRLRKLMVESIIGSYLVDSGRITRQQFRAALDKMDSVRVKLGLIAVSEGFMTFAQAEEVNRLQAMCDKRFGDIAVEKGYLTDEQVGKLLKRQGDAYLTFIQALEDDKLITIGELSNV